MPKKSTLPESVKRQHQREKRLLSRRMASQAAHDLDAARSELNTAAMRQMTRVFTVNRDAVFSAIHAMVSTVAKSWGVGAPIHLRQSYNSTVAASTDFTSVTISYPENSTTWVSNEEVGKFNESALRTLVSDIKGLAYHEVGHIRFTVPFNVLHQMARLPDPIEPNDMLRYKRIWNVLEDQRMESAVVEESPIVAKYFTTMVLQWLFKVQRLDTPPDQYVLIIGRRYLPRSLRMSMRDAYIDAYGLENTQKVEATVRAYKAADNAADMWAQVVALSDLLTQMGGLAGGTGKDTPDEHNNSGRWASDNSDEKRIMSSASSDEGDDASEGAASATPTDEEGDSSQSAASSKSDDSTDEEEGEQKNGMGGEAGSDAQSQQDPSGGGYSPTGSNIKDELREMLNEAMEEVRNGNAVDEVIRDINERANTATSSLPSSVSTSHQSPVMQAKAEELASALVPTLEVYTSDFAPIWQTRQTRGIIDPFAYRTRASGSREYHRQYNDTGDSGIDIAVTIALDISSSMCGSEQALGAVAYASKKACDVLGIPCTITVFNQQGAILWNPEDEPTSVALITDGGTSPISLFDALDEQVYDRGTHLVILMTDGLFTLGGNTVHKWRNDETNRFFVGLAYGAEYNVRMLQNLGFDHAQYISDLLQIPDILASFVASFLR